MMQIRQKITPCLWFDTQAEEAVNFYLGIFPDSRIMAISHYTETGKEIHHKQAGSVMSIEFLLRGQTFTALNGGPDFKFNEALSLQISCINQEEIDHYWERLAAGGDQNFQQCGWLKDRYGLCWQVVPDILPKMLLDQDRAKASRAMHSMLFMKKLDIQELQNAFEGN